MESVHELIRSFISSVELSREHACWEWNYHDSLVNLWRTTQPACRRGQNCEDVIHVLAVIRS